MKRKRHTPDQIVGKLRAADDLLSSGRPLTQVLSQLGISEPTFHRWRNQYGGIKSEDARRLQELLAENSRLRRLVKERELDIAILREANECLGKLQAPPD